MATREEEQALEAQGLEVLRTFLTAAADWLAGRAKITVSTTVDSNGVDKVHEVRFKRD